MITKWPDLTKEDEAWELAKAAAEPNEPLSNTISRQLRIKKTLTQPKLTEEVQQ